jgi:hypothetical protein
MGLFDRFQRKSTAAAPKPAKHSDTLREAKPYRSVQIIANVDDCCQAVRDLQGQRYLMSQVPMLPLALCDADTCHCTYQRFDDRRLDLRRTSDFAHDLLAQFAEEDNRSNEKPGRREDD